MCTRLTAAQATQYACKYFARYEGARHLVTVPSFHVDTTDEHVFDVYISLPGGGPVACMTVWYDTARAEIYGEW